MRVSIQNITARFNAGLIFLALLPMTGVSLSLPSDSAHASATGCSVGNVFLDPNLYCATISGSGTYVNYVSGTFRGGAVICNYYITAEFFRTNWSWYQTYKSSTTYGCANGDGKSIGIYSYKSPGFMCSTLHYNTPNGKARAMSVCHRIY